MLTFPKTEQEKFDCIMSSQVAYDPETKIALVRSRGRRASGRNTRYWLSGVVETQSFTAPNDEVALEKANAIIARLAQGMPTAS